MAEYDKQRIFVYRDVISGKEKELSEFAAITIMTQGQFIVETGMPRFQFVRSFIPKVKAVKSVTRSEGDRTQNFDRITEVEETDVQFQPPRIKRKDGMTKLPTSWFGKNADDLPEAPEGIQRR